MDEYRAFQNGGGLFRAGRGLVKVSGPDRLSFLQAITSQDLRTLGSDQGAPAALLTGNGTVISFFDIYNCGQFFLLSVADKFLQACAAYLEKMHFAEDLQIENLADEFVFLSVQGTHSMAAVRSVLGKASKRDFEALGSEEAFIIRRSDFNSPGYHLFMKHEYAPQILDDLKNAGLSILSREFWNQMRTFTGHFEFGRDLDEKNLIMESPSAGAVSRDKGCYPGQETVERIFTYGNISKKLMGLKFSGELKTTHEKLKLKSSDHDAGYVTSFQKIPWSSEVLGFGVVRKPFYEAGQKLLVEGTAIDAEVYVLPDTFEIKKSN